MIFDADRPLTHRVLDHATVIAFGTDKARGVQRPAGVLDRTGAPVDLAQCWRDSRQPVTQPCALPADTSPRHLPGTWLFGGMLYAHFGHFLCESTARLWGIDLQGHDISGVLYHPKPKLTRPARLLDPTRPWLAVAGVTLPVEAPADPVTVDRLLIPEQGFGTGDMVAGRPEYRAYLRRHFGAQIAPDGGARMYISRSRLYSKRGRILGETLLEQHLAAQGYEVFHPQEHPIDTQIARYKAARQIISTDCSALHLAAFFADPTDQVAIIARRPGPTVDDFIAQYRAFCGLVPRVSSHLTALHGLAGAKLAQMSEVYAEADFALIQQDLHAAGFIAAGPRWSNPDPQQIAAELADYAERQNAEIGEMQL